MGFSRRESFIERRARETGWIIAVREDDYYKLRPANARRMDYLAIRHRDGSPFAVFRTDLPVQFPVASAPPDLFRLLLFRNDLTFCGKWIAELIDSCDIILYQLYPALQAGLTPKLFDQIGRSMLNERESFHAELRQQLTRMTSPPGMLGQQADWQNSVGNALPSSSRPALTGGNQQGIGWNGSNG